MAAFFLTYVLNKVCMYVLHKLLDSCYYPAKLYPSQIEEACYIFEHNYRRQTTKANMLSLCYLQNPRKDYNKRLTTPGSKIYKPKYRLLHI